MTSPKKMAPMTSPRTSTAKEPAMITFTSTHGLHSVTEADMDRAMENYLPSSVGRLRDIVSDRVNGCTYIESVKAKEDGYPHVVDYGDIDTVSGFLVILADFDRTDGQ